MGARHVVEAYHNSWTKGKPAEARSYLDNDLHFQGSIDKFRRADDFVKTRTQIQRMLKGVTPPRNFFSENGSVLLYDCDTMSPAGVIRAAEFFKVENGEINEARLFFNGNELRKLMGSRYPKFVLLSLKMA
ncbi:MAG TPA: hypothetical protein VI935_07895 [Thermodesulfobacteriota bacterium]|nr:hypothetical protein [Thermodesulfobacteriota bacterium]